MRVVLTMRLTGSVVSPAGAPELWRTLRDPARLTGALPGVRLIGVIDERTVRVWTPVGATVFLLTLHIEEEREPAYVRITGKGRSGEVAVGLSVEIDLLPGEDGTTVAWAGDVHVHAAAPHGNVAES